MRLKSDLLPALIATRDGNLKDVDLRWYDEAALCVVMAARGYPDDPLRGTEIRGLDRAASDPEVKIFHAGTRREGERLIADGGRVLGVTARGKDLASRPRARLPRRRPDRLARRLLPTGYRGAWRALIHRLAAEASWLYILANSERTQACR